MKTDVSFVVLTHNDWKTAVNAISSIKKIKAKYSYDIFAVDNGSKDNTPAILKEKFRDIKVIKLPKNIGTAAYDAAIKKSNSKYIYFTGCDIEIKEDALDKLVNFLEKKKDVILAAPKYINFYNRKKIDLGGTWLSKSFYSGTFKDSTLGSKNIEIPYIGTGLIRTYFVRKFGYLFDNDYFFYGEDVDLGLRIGLLGFKIYYIPDSVVYHISSASRSIHKHHYLTFLMERNLLTTFFKILQIKNILLFLPYVFLMRIVAIIKDMLNLNFKNVIARMSAMFWVVLNIKKIIKKRGLIQEMRKVKDKDLFWIFSEKYLFKF